MKSKYKLLSLSSMRSISCADKEELTQNAQVLKNKGIPFMMFRLNPETDNYIPLVDSYTYQ